jgi:hypothetical protein
LIEPYYGSRLAQVGSVGSEIDLLYLGALLMLAIQGPGPLALDNARQGRRIRSASRETNGSAYLQPLTTLIGRTVHNIGNSVSEDDSAAKSGRGARNCTPARMHPAALRRRGHGFGQPYGKAVNRF